MSRRRLFNIPLHHPSFGKKEIRAACRALSSGRIGGGGQGSFSKKLEEAVSIKLGVSYVLLTTSCTHSIELALMALDIGRGDEVLCPSFSFPSIPNAILRQGAAPVFVDIRPDTFNMDPEHMKKCISRRTKAVIPVHYGGVGCDLDVILPFLNKYGIPLVEDAAHTLGARYMDAYLGTIGMAGCFSLHETKNITCGEGGIFVTNNRKMFRNAEMIRDKGTNRAAFLEGKVKSYSWKTIGSSFVISELLAAVALEQFKKMDRFSNMRSRIADYYTKELSKFQSRIQLPFVPKKCASNWHIYAILVPAHRNKILSYMHSKKISVSFHYTPLHLSSFGMKVLGCERGSLPVTEYVASRIIRLPIYPSLTRRQQNYILRCLARAIEKTL